MIYLLTRNVTDKKNISACTCCLQRKIHANFELELMLSKNFTGVKYRILTNNRKYSSQHIGSLNKLPIFPNNHLFLTKRKKQGVKLFVFFFPPPQNNSAMLWLFSSLLLLF